MANGQMRSVASLLMVLNFCMYVILLGIGGWAMNRAIDHGFIIGPGFDLPAHFSPIYFPMGNASTGFFVTFALIAGVVGVASILAGFDHYRSWSSNSRPAAVSSAIIAWSLTVLAMGFAWKEIELEGRNARLRTMEAFTIILSATQLIYVAALHG
ncbi:membrane protein PM19L-like [Cynara cardunculus var. scolymus]|uniref:AWPM-19-like protein n=1 Tax=Cynara cardunculus var. scolymus TaxID=59895 RepID=A0A103XET0_CYNCS|nr:membrane protein PM19L-like [Cynara cardunculus var. scolymus]KVH89420.1 AWPM-19-like protein [Cynara cardunculus var. scolymus]